MNALKAKVYPSGSKSGTVSRAMAGFVMILMCLLGAGFLSVRIASAIRVPHSVFLVLLGLLSGAFFRGHAPTQAALVTTGLADYFPGLILYVLLPPLIFESSFHLSFESLKKEIVPVTALAVIALLVSTVLIGYGLNLLCGLPLLPCLTFGALISATDPVAVVALFRELGAPQRLSTLIEGESLLNDGTAIVVFRLLLTSAMATPPSTTGLLSGAAQFGLLAGGSILLGLAIAGLTSLLLRVSSPSGAAQLGITLVSAYLTFILSDAYFHLSGVLSTLVVGVYLGQRVRLELNREALKGIHQIWEFLALSANTLVFIAVGMTVDPSWILRGASYVPVTLLIVYAARAISVSATLPVINRFRLSEPIGFSYQAALIWGGLRGGLALGLALTLPPGFPHKELFLALAMAVALSTLIINALTARRVLALLGLDKLGGRDPLFFRQALKRVTDETYSTLSRIGREEGLSARLIEEHCLAANSGILPETRGGPEFELRFKLTSLLSQERRTYEERFEEGVLSKRAYLKVIESVIARVAVLEASGPEKLRRTPLKIGLAVGWRDKLLFALRGKSADRLLGRLVVQLEASLQMKSALDAALRSCAGSEPQALYVAWLAELDQGLKEFYTRYSHYSAAAQAQVISDAAYSVARRAADRLLALATINQPIHAKLLREFEALHRRTSSQSRTLLRPSAAYLLGRIPLFRLLPRVTLRTLAELSTVRLLSPGKVLIEAGEARPAVFVLIAGILNSSQSGRPGRTFVPGSFFGIRSLIDGLPHASTLVAEVTSEVLVVERDTLNAVLADYPTLLTPPLSEALLDDSFDRA